MPIFKLFLIIILFLLNKTGSKQPLTQRIITSHMAILDKSNAQT